MWIEKTCAAGLVFALVGLAAPVMAHEDHEVHKEDGVVFVRHVYGDADHEGTGEPQTSACGSEEAATTLPTMAQYCTTGTHESAFVYLLLGFDARQHGLTGTLDNVVVSDDGEARFRCQWVEGEWTGCQVLSTYWPAAGQPFCHYLWAYETAVLPLAPVPDVDDCGRFQAPAGIGAPDGPWRGHLTHA